MPASHIRLTELHVAVESINVHFPLDRSTSVFEILLKNLCPLFAFNVLSNKLGSSIVVSLGDVEASAELDIPLEFLVGLVISVVEGTTLKVDDSGTSVHVVDGGGQGNLGSEPMTSHRSHGELVLIHKPSNVVGDVL